MKVKVIMSVGVGLTTLSLISMEANPDIARVIFAETGGKCSVEEMRLVGSVIKNRIAHPGFGNGMLKSMHDSAYQKGAFSYVNDKRNGNWAIGLKYMHGSKYTKEDDNAWNVAMALSVGTFHPEPDIVYYHDKSIVKPKSWDNQYWEAVKSIETKHFIFYKVVKK